MASRVSVLMALGMAGCAVGGPQIGPLTASGYHTREDKVFVSGDAVNGGEFYRQTNQSHSNFGLLFGWRLGAASASVGGVGAGLQKAAEVHFDAVYAIGRLGFGLGTAYGYESASGVNKQDYSMTGLALTLLGQYALTEHLFVRAGLGRLSFAGIHRAEQPGDSLSSSFQDDADVTPYRATLGLTLIFSNSEATQYGAAIELRATHTGDATIQGVNVQWSSVGVMAQVLYIKF